MKLFLTPCQLSWRPAVAHGVHAQSTWQRKQKAHGGWRRASILTLIPLNGNSIERVESRFSILGLERTQNSRRENQPFLLLLKMFIPKEANLTDLPSLRQGEPKKPPVRGEEGGGRAQGRPWWRAQRGEEQPAQHRGTLLTAMITLSEGCSDGPVNLTYS